MSDENHKKRFRRLNIDHLPFSREDFEACLAKLKENPTNVSEKTSSALFTYTEAIVTVLFENCGFVCANEIDFELYCSVFCHTAVEYLVRRAGSRPFSSIFEYIIYLQDDFTLKTVNHRYLKANGSSFRTYEKYRTGRVVQRLSEDGNWSMEQETVAFAEMMGYKKRIPGMYELYIRPPEITEDAGENVGVDFIFDSPSRLAGNALSGLMEDVDADEDIINIVSDVFLTYDPKGEYTSVLKVTALCYYLYVSMRNAEGEGNVCFTCKKRPHYTEEAKRFSNILNGTLQELENRGLTPFDDTGFGLIDRCGRIKRIGIKRVLKLKHLVRTGLCSLGPKR